MLSDYLCKYIITVTQSLGFHTTTRSGRSFELEGDRERDWVIKCSQHCSASEVSCFAARTWQTKMRKERGHSLGLERRDSVMSS